MKKIFTVTILALLTLGSALVFTGCHHHGHRDHRGRGKNEWRAPRHNHKPAPRKPAPKPPRR